MINMIIIDVLYLMYYFLQASKSHPSSVIAPSHWVLAMVNCIMGECSLINEFFLIQLFIPPTPTPLNHAYSGPILFQLLPVQFLQGIVSFLLSRTITYVVI